MSARKCARWCDFSETGPHNGRCISHVGEVVLSEPRDSYAIAVTIESDDRHPHPYLTVAGRGSVSYALARLTWDETDHLAHLLSGEGTGSRVLLNRAISSVPRSR